MADIDPTGPAYKGGIREGYIILEVDGKPGDTMTGLKCLLYKKQPGESVKVKYKTLTGKEGYVTIVLGK
ncbi:trypsin-like serine protease [Caldanaerobacter subterraneus subsp. pacificus DSM 12653]|uniref:Trypsin-like serine protease n=1 Tax=Caldanaerobacter subterraneus subsp. pacificus DSM 12653 TaxID=391606 RepID=A0A0F5PIT3_9THEO|nr:PDZ domain-containing protein [Caldanaerobacter subterraneus]KKC28568.1 trypsin-like serine protease [Caldanaerobacter subterraneus subsp. pacificus DSM 12653]